MANESTLITMITFHPSTSSLPEGNVYQNLDLNRLVYIIVALVISITGIIGNSIVILAILLSRKLRSTLNWFVFNLACADLLTSFSIPFEVSKWLLPDANYTQYWLYGILIGIAVSLTTHAFIAFTSWYLITKNHAKSKKLFSTRNISIMIMFSWVFTIICASIIYVINDILPVSYPAFLVEGVWIFGHFVIIIVAYFKLWRFVALRENKMKKRYDAAKQTEIVISTTSYRSNPTGSLDNVPSTQHTSPSTEPSASETSVQESPHLEQSATMEHGQTSRNIPAEASSGVHGAGTERAIESRTKTLAVTKNLLIVLAAFVICFIPYPFTAWIDPTFTNVHPWGVALMFFNSCINPIIYARRIRAFREVMVCIIRCRLGSIPMPVECLRRMTNTR